MNEMFDVRGKVALVTGGSRGIGAMIAAGLVDAGVTVYINARRAPDCDAMAAELSQRGTCISLPGDLTTLEGIEWLAAQLAERTPRLDIVVNNAGSGSGGSIDSFDEARWDKVVDLNLKAIFFLTQKLMPLLRAGGSIDDPARIINIGSTAGFQTSTKQLDNYAYAASKAGAHHLTRIMAHKFAPEITVNAIAPGPFPTKMIAFALADRPALEASVPRRRLGTPADIAGTVIWLCSPAGSYVTGAVIPVDGGLSLG